MYVYKYTHTHTHTNGQKSLSSVFQAPTCTWWTENGEKENGKCPKKRQRWTEAVRQKEILSAVVGAFEKESLRKKRPKKRQIFFLNRWTNSVSIAGILHDGDK